MYLSLFMSTCVSVWVNHRYADAPGAREGVGSLSCSYLSWVNWTQVLSKCSSPPSGLSNTTMGVFFLLSARCFQNLFFTALEHSSSNTISRPLSGLLGFLSSLCTAWVFNYCQGAGVTAVGVVPGLSRPILARKLLPLQPHASSQRVRIPFLLLKEMLNLGGLMWGKGSKGLGWGKGQ